MLPLDFFGERLPTWKVLASADILADLRSEASHVDGQFFVWASLDTGEDLKEVRYTRKTRIRFGSMK